MKVGTVERFGDWIESNEGKVIERQWDFSNGKTAISQFQWYKGKVIAERRLYRNNLNEVYFKIIHDRRNFWQKLFVKIHFKDPYNHNNHETK